MIQNKHILIHNIYYMLSYVFQALNRSDDEDRAPEAFENIHNLFAAILSKGIGVQLKQGLYRTYLNRQENLSTLRGRIVMPGTLQNRLARRRVLTCEYDELSENNLFNQILKTTAQLLLRHGQVKPLFKDALRQKLLFFTNVDTVAPQAIRWGDIRFQRNNQSYRMLLGICQLTLEGMLLATEAGERRLAAFLDDQRMCRLYEKFLLEYYIRHHPELSPRAAQIPWALDDGVSALLPVMQTDITLQKGNHVLIIDAKYYSHTLQSQYDRHTLHSGKNEQILSGALAAYTVTVQWAFTLAARLLLAFLMKDRNPFKALAVMGVGMTVMYGVLLKVSAPLPALIALALFAFCVAGVYPLTLASIGDKLSPASVGILLSFAGIGGIVFPWLVGIVADAAGLRTGMAVNLIPCVGITVLSLLLLSHRKGQEHNTTKKERNAV